ncbi:type II toxin-antitoxin system HigB family toxin [Methylobacterium sp. NEAU 140]|uniref:type II toxin-antitoxin system HigB family toxin n=1 Tax=Methylobacterium sp. NEAU 140 TaxID=3064945 RepID=UPI0027376C0F|nr:type II toxin-antitoxin system HigB family toxin [Methylobacterium sp. NEAU 140]MDP4026771.1 type II toxin-antitoxin system HigB family toxin [Methylobacterium sp. NEAU 140]
MQVIAKRRLQEFWERHPRSEPALREWYARASKAQWTGPEDVKTTFGKGVDFVGDNRVIFDIRRNEFRLIVHVAYAHRRVLIKFIGTHAEYDRIDTETVSL